MTTDERIEYLVAKVMAYADRVSIHGTEKRLENLQSAIRAALEEAVSQERARCLYWYEMGDSDGYSASFIREGTPIKA